MKKLISILLIGPLFTITVLTTLLVISRPALADTNSSDSAVSNEDYETTIAKAKQAVADKEKKCKAEGDDSENCTHKQEAMNRIARACFGFVCRLIAQESDAEIPIIRPPIQTITMPIGTR